MARGKRTRVAKGIYRDAYGLAGVVTVGRSGREQRFQPDADFEDIRAWQQRTRGELLIEQPMLPSTRRKDPFRSAVGRYLKELAGRPGFASDRSHLMAWVAEFDERERATITAADVRLVFAKWRTGGQRRRKQKIARPLKPQTLRHRYRVLKKLYHTLDGPDAKTPLDDIPRPAVPRSEPTDVPIATIKAVATKLARRDVKAHARFLVLATTGKAPAELMRADAGDVNLRARTWRVDPAKGRNPQTLHLNAEMVAAWKQFIAVEAWGTYSTTQQARILRACGWPRGVRPYNVRHALAIELLRRGADLSDIQAHLGHTSMETTRKHYAGILASRAKATTKLLESRLGLVPPIKARLSAKTVPRSRRKT